MALGPTPNPPYYFPPAPGWVVGGAIVSGIAWCAGFAIGNAIWDSFDWGHGNIRVDINKHVDWHDVKRGDWHHDSHHRRGVSYNNKDVRNKYARGPVRDGDRKLDYRGRGGKQVLAIVHVATAAALTSARASAATRGLISAKDLVATKADPERGRRRLKARSRISANDPTRGGQS
jgi:hypothetical protein